MAPSKRKHHHHHLPPPPSPPSSSFIPAISTVAVAQICLSVGYTSAEPSALRSLSSIATLYLQTLASSAASIAASKCRTQSNLLDLIRAIEDLYVARGFAGASDPTRPLLKSSVVKELSWFVRSVDEIPFAKPIRKLSPSNDRVSAASFAELGREPPLVHVPRWLPCFPEGWERRGRERKERGEERRRWEEGGGGRWIEREVGLGFEEEGKLNGRIVMGKNNGVWNKKVLVMMEEEKEGSWVRELLEVEREKGEIGGNWEEDDENEEEKRRIFVGKG